MVCRWMDCKHLKYGTTVMGEAKRRKAAGWTPKSIQLELFIAQSMLSDAHAVHLGIGRSKGVEVRRYNSFSSIVDAWKSLCEAKSVLPKLRYHSQQSNDEISRNLIQLIHNTYGFASNDDANCQLSGDKKAGLEWIAQGANPYTDQPPPGCFVEVTVPPVRKKHKVLLLKNEEKSALNNLSANPENYCVFTVGESHSQLIAQTEKEVFLYSSYVSAAYLADYLNIYHLDTVSGDVRLKLLYEANLLQGKVEGMASLPSHYEWTNVKAFELFNEQNHSEQNHS